MSKSTAARDPNACLLIRVHVPNGCTDPRIDASLCVRATEDGRDFPRTPETVNGLACEHGNLGVRAWVFQGRASGSDGPEYERLSYVDARKLEAYTKTIRTLRTRLGKMHETRGSMASWAEYVLRFAEACGAPLLCFPVETLHRIDRHNDRAPRETHGARWEFVKVAHAAHLLRDLEASFDVSSPSADRAVVRSA